MKKKYLALLLALVLAVGLLPGTVFAADYTYTEVIPCQYDAVKDFSEGLAAVCLDGKWGFIDKTGELVIPCQYDGVSSFSEGLAAVRIGALNTGKWGYIDKTGQVVIPIQYERGGDFSEGLAPIGVRNGTGKDVLGFYYCNWGFIDKTGQVVIPLQYNWAYSFSEGLAAVRVNGPTGPHGFIDKTGEVVVPCKYYAVQSFSEGLAVVRAADYPHLGGYVDKEGNEVIPCQYTEAWDFSEGLASVYVGELGYGKIGFIDKTGQEVLSPQYGGQDNMMYTFSEGLAAVKNEYGIWGYINKEGNQVLPFQYLEAGDFSDGFALVQMGSTRASGKWGFINKTGEVVVPCQYDSTSRWDSSTTRDIYDVGKDFSEGLIAVYIGEYAGGKWGFISINSGSASTDPEPTDPTEPELPTKFTDVPAGAYYADAVNWAVENGITSGTGNGTTFSPNEPCTRGQIVTFLWRAHGEQEPTITENPFTDVKPSDYYYKAVLWAVEKGITQGTSATTFNPSGTCTRDQAVTFQWRAAGRPIVSGGSSFTDVDSAAYYADAVAWAVSNNITNGTSATTFNPSGICDRGQIVTFLYREMGQSPTPTPEPADPSSYIKLAISGENYSEVKNPPVYTNDMLYNWETDTNEFRSLDGCFALPREAQLTVSNLANAGDDCYIQIRLWQLEEVYHQYDTNSYYLDSLYHSVLTNNGGFIGLMASNSPEYGGTVQLRPGESATFSLSEYETIYDETGEAVVTYDFFVLALALDYPDAGQGQTVYYGFTFEK